MGQDEVFGRHSRGLHTHGPMYFNDLTTPSDKFNGDKTTTTIGEPEIIREKLPPPGSWPQQSIQARTNPKDGR
jgi:hypothetical protein